MSALPPGTLLQLMYLEERLGTVLPGRFIEVGPGAGEITQVLLDRGSQGQSYDLESRTISRLEQRFSREIDEKRFAAVNKDFLVTAPSAAEKVDLIISCMVMEHFDDAAESTFMRVARQVLKPSGLMIGLVPGSPAHWGIEDDIAGHCRRYTQASVRALASGNRWNLMHVAGLTYPVSNLLLPISNFLVRRSESSKLNLTPLERTKQSGRREVKYKTHFPAILRICLNRATMTPVHALQKLFSRSERALVIYFEARPPMESSNV